MSKIPWTEKTWNPVVGCTKCSPGCLNCYAERMAGRLANMHQEKYAAVVKHETRHEGIEEDPQFLFLPKWNGKVFCDESVLENPLDWHDPRKIFVCSMGDLFHEKVPFEFIDKIEYVTSQTPQHTYQILTKRADRMLEYFSEKFWPFTNVHLGVSISTPDELHKAETLKRIPAAVKFISFEPLLADMGKVNLEGIGQIIIGAESKGSHPGRLCELDWAKNLIDQCKGPVFVKQLHINGKLSKDPKEWPAWAQRQEYPECQQ